MRLPVKKGGADIFRIHVQSAFMFRKDVILFFNRYVKFIVDVVADG